MTTQHLPHLDIHDLGCISYAEAYRQQVEMRDVLITARRQHEMEADPKQPMQLLLLEHCPPVITISKRPGVEANIIADHDAIAEQGIEIVQTDRGGDITYHGPGQLVAYTIFDLKRLRLGVSDYMRWLEDIVIRTLSSFEIVGERDKDATGVWVADKHVDLSSNRTTAKICAMGIRVSRWIAMHGLALNVQPDLTHFDNIVPCGLTGRRVTSIEAIQKRCGQPEQVPSMDEVKQVFAQHCVEAVIERIKPE